MAKEDIESPASRPIRIWPALVAIIVAIIGVSALAIILYRQVSGDKIARNRREQGIVASQQAARLGEVLRDLTLDLVALSRHPDVATFEPDGVRPPGTGHSVFRPTGWQHLGDDWGGTP